MKNLMLLTFLIITAIRSGSSTDPEIYSGYVKDYGFTDHKYAPVGRTWGYETRIHHGSHDRPHGDHLYDFGFLRHLT